MLLYVHVSACLSVCLHACVAASPCVSVTVANVHNAQGNYSMAQPEQDIHNINLYVCMSPSMSTSVPCIFYLCMSVCVYFCVCMCPWSSMFIFVITEVTNNDDENFSSCV